LGLQALGLGQHQGEGGSQSQHQGPSQGSRQTLGQRGAFQNFPELQGTRDGNGEGELQAGVHPQQIENPHQIRKLSVIQANLQRWGIALAAAQHQEVTLSSLSRANVHGLGGVAKAPGHAADPVAGIGHHHLHQGHQMLLTAF
jgi:hypothetical protein